MNKLIIYILIFLCSFMPMGCASLLPHPEPLTKEDWLALGVMTSGKVADGISASKMLENPNNRELNPVLGERPSDKEIIGYIAITGSIIGLIGWAYPEIRKPLWYFSGGINWGAAVGNSWLSKKKK